MNSILFGKKIFIVYRILQQQINRMQTKIGQQKTRMKLKFINVEFVNRLCSKMIAKNIIQIMQNSIHNFHLYQIRPCQLDAEVEERKDKLNYFTLFHLFLKKKKQTKYFAKTFRSCPFFFLFVYCYASCRLILNILKEKKRIISFLITIEMSEFEAND